MRHNPTFALAHAIGARCIPALLLAGCGGMQSALAPQGPHARVIANISWVMFIGAAGILLLVMVLALYAIYRRPERRRAPKANVLIIAGGVALPVVTLSALLGYGVYAMAELRQPAADAVQIEVVGNRWWWDVHYRDTDGSLIATANEIRIPAGQAVTVRLTSKDVIHSFWVPNLAGKMDLVPGRFNHIVLQADRAGVFRGQCAEFCGAQHARMAFYVVAESQQDYDAWLARQRMPAHQPTDALALRGRDAFTVHCLECHTVRGVGRARQPGPDLTHVGSRLSLAAGVLDNRHENLVAFISRSQDIKPGSGMPSFAHLDDATLQTIARYLESLQ